MLLERYAHEPEARKRSALATNPGAVGHVLGTPGWAEQRTWRLTEERTQGKVVDGRRLELPTSGDGHRKATSGVPGR
jgi:hypothetical protein